MHLAKSCVRAFLKPCLAHCRLRVFIDGTVIRDVLLSNSGQQSSAIISTTSEQHTLRLAKLSDPQDGSAVLQSISLNAGRYLQAQSLLKDVIAIQLASCVLICITNIKILCNFPGDAIGCNIFTNLLPSASFFRNFGRQ